MLLSDVSLWGAAEYLLRDLLNYAVKCAVEDGTFDRDKHQVEHFLTAWRSLSPKDKSQNANGPIANVGPTSCNSVEEWRRLFSRMTTKQAAEVVVANEFLDPFADYGHCVRVLADVLQAWAANVNGGRSGVLPLKR
jgi:hypothetical protein